MSKLSISLLGPPRAELDGEPIHIGRRKAVALLVYLAVEKDPHSRDALAALLWPEFDQRGARAELRRALSTLNRALGKGWLIADRETVGLNPDVDPSAGLRKAQSDSSGQSLWVDVLQFRQLLVACETHGHPVQDACAECRSRLSEAVALYRDDFLSGFSVPDSLAFDEWQRFQTLRSRDELGSALERLAGHLAALGEYDEAIAQARRQVDLDPTHEPAHRQLMTLYAQAGQRAVALRQFRTCVRVLEGELGLSPSPETTALHDQIRSGQLGPARAQPAPIETLWADLPSHNLPAQPNLFIGREQELADLLGLIRDPAVRLVTVVGAGGLGKTRLALQAAADVLGGFPEGVWLAELARVTAHDAVTQAVARALGVQPQPDRDLADTIVDALRTRQLLLVCDNCEHVLDGVAPLLDKLLARCPELKLLATSREALHIPGERLYVLPPMRVPAPEDPPDLLLAADAVYLFVERARDIQPTFAVVDDNAGDVADICRRLDGMPLAIELAAARMRALSPREIAVRLDDRFRLLTGGARTLLPRQQTLHNTVTWSYELLDEAERTLFNRLSVFRGGFTIAAAESTCSGDGVLAGKVLDYLASLVDKSLVVVTLIDGGTTRYRLLETLRQYGAERLKERGETESICLRHALYYVELAEEIGALLDLWEDWAGLYQRLDPETDNIASAMRWSLAHDRADIALRLGSALIWWLFTRPHYGQYTAWLTHALQECDDVAPRYRAKALHTLNFYCWFYNRYDEESPRSAAQELDAAEEAGDPELVALALLSLGRIAEWRGQQERALDFYQRSLAAGREASNQACIIEASVHIATFRKPDEALAMLRALLLQTPKAGRYFVLQTLSPFVSQAGNLTEAERYGWQAFEEAGELGSDAFQVKQLYMLGVFALLKGDYDRAEWALTQCRRLARHCGAMPLLAEASRVLGETAWYQGDVDLAESRWTEALDLAHQHGDPAGVAEVRQKLSYAVCAKGDIERAEALCRLSLDGFVDGDVFGRGIATLALARVAFFRGDPTRAAELFRICLHDLHLGRNWPDTIRAMEGLAWACAALTRHEETLRLLGFLAAERERTGIGMLLPPVDQPHHDNALISAREALGPEAFAAAWEEGAQLTLQEAAAAAMA